MYLGSIELSEELGEHSVADPGGGGASLPGQGVDLVEEHDRGRRDPRLAEQLLDRLLALTQILAQDLRTPHYNALSCKKFRRIFQLRYRLESSWSSLWREPSPTRSRGLLKG